MCYVDSEMGLQQKQKGSDPWKQSENSKKNRKRKEKNEVERNLQI